MRSRVPVVVAAALAAGLLSACSGDESAEPETDVVGYTDELETTLTESFALELEVQEVVNRLLVDCMTEAGFEVHPFYLSKPPRSWEADFNAYPAVGSAPPGLRDLPVSVEVAAEKGVNLGSQFGPDYPYGTDVGPDDHLDLYWSEMTPEYRSGYEVALNGQTDEERYSADAEDPSEPLPGCRSEVYDEVGFAEEDVLRPAVLDSMAIGSGPYETVEVLDAWDEWTMCVADRDHPEIEYRNGSVAPWNYVALFYDGDNIAAAVDPQSQSFDAPTGAPWPHEEALEKEIAFAVDLAECADEVQLRTIGQNAWDEVMRTFAVENETEIFAWYKVLQDSLAGAQAVLSK